MSSSDNVKALINQAYKQNRHEDDLNQPRAVQPWGSDGDKRRYFLVEGQDDTNFRVYRESNPQGTNRTWWSVAGSIEELKVLSDKLEQKDGGPKAKKLSQKILGALPRFESGEDVSVTPSALSKITCGWRSCCVFSLAFSFTDSQAQQKRRRREYRQTQKERFKRPEPGFSLYEGRTRGKRIKYTYSDDEDMFYSDSTNRRSARNTGTTTPAETGPVTTSSGRQIRAPPRLNAAGGDSAPGSIQGDTPEFDEETSVGPTGRPRRSAAATHAGNGWTGSEQRPRRNASMDSDEESEGDFGDDEDDHDAHVPEESDEEDEFDEEEAMVDDDLDDKPRSLMVKLSVTPPKLRGALVPIDHQVANTLPTRITQDEKPLASSEAQALDVKMAQAPLDKSSVNVAHPTSDSVLVGGASANVKASTPEPAGRAEEAELAKESSITATPLAFRGSPEKQPTQAISQPFNGINGGD